MSTAVANKNVTPLEEVNTFENFMQAPAVRERVAAVLPTHLNAERMMRTVALAAYKNPKIRDVHMMSLLGAVMTCATMGFEPNTPLGHAYLIPFEKNKFNRATSQWEYERTDVNVVFGYPGLIDLARRTGSLVSITAKVAYVGDEFSFEYGSNQHLRHRPVGLVGTRKPLYAYAFAKLTDGEAFEALPYEEALAFRRYSQSWLTAQKQIEDAQKNPKEAWKAKNAGDTPWIKHEVQMVQKTMIRRLSTWLPKNIEFARAHAIDGLADAGKIDFSALAALPPAEAKEMLEAGVTPEKEADDQGDGSTPDKRPEREEEEKKTPRKRTAKADDKPKDETPPKTDDTKPAGGETNEPKGETKQSEGEPTDGSEYSDLLLDYIDQVNSATTSITTVRLSNEAREKLEADEHAILMKAIAKRNEELSAAKKGR